MWVPIRTKWTFWVLEAEDWLAYELLQISNDCCRLYSQLRWESSEPILLYKLFLKIINLSWPSLKHLIFTDSPWVQLLKPSISSMSIKICSAYLSGELQKVCENASLEVLSNWLVTERRFAQGTLSITFQSRQDQKISTASTQRFRFPMKLNFSLRASKKIAANSSDVMMGTEADGVLKLLLLQTKKCGLISHVIWGKRFRTGEIPSLAALMIE